MNNKVFSLSVLVLIIIFIIIAVINNTGLKVINTGVTKNESPSASGVCPPFNLYDEDNNIINPVNNINSDAPYSPKQTCGKCHDYEKITQGFHFQQGRGEKPTEEMSKRYQWVTSPGSLWRHLVFTCSSLQKTCIQAK
jgi:hypothetical protein